MNLPARHAAGYLRNENLDPPLPYPLPPGAREHGYPVPRSKLRGIVSWIESTSDIIMIVGAEGELSYVSPSCEAAGIPACGSRLCRWRARLPSAGNSGAQRGNNKAIRIKATRYQSTAMWSYFLNALIKTSLFSAGTFMRYTPLGILYFLMWRLYILKVL